MPNMKKISKIENIEEFVWSYVSKLAPESVISKSEANKRASEFLYAAAIISCEKKRISDELISVESANRVIYASTFARQSDKNVTEKKLKAEADPEFIEVREMLETLENNINYLKTQEKVFENAHVFYRNLYRGD
jgi:hypothetical protein